MVDHPLCCTAMGAKVSESFALDHREGVSRLVGALQLFEVDAVFCIFSKDRDLCLDHRGYL